MQRSNSSDVISKLDIEKAYDQVNFGRFLLAILDIVQSCSIGHWFERSWGILVLASRIYVGRYAKYTN